MNILILGNQRPAHKVLYDLGHQVSLFISKDKSFPSDLKGIYCNTFTFDTNTDPQVYIDAAVALHRANPIDRVVAFNDVWQQLAYDIACELDVPSNVNIDALASSFNKNLMRSILEIQNIGGIKYAVSHDLDGVANSIRKVGLPCVVKPVSGEGSQGVLKIESEDEVKRYISSMTVGDSVLIESFIDGDEYSVESISEGGKHYIVAITKKFKGVGSVVEQGHAVPADIPPSLKLEISKYVQSVLTALSFQSGPSHTEIIYSDRSPVVVETHTRLGGDRIVNLVKLATGVDMYDLVARQSIGELVASDIPEDIPCLNHAAVWFLLEGIDNSLVVDSIRGLQEQLDIDYVDTIHLFKTPGDRGGPVEDSFSRSALAIVVGDSQNQAVSRAQDVINKLTFTYRYQLEG
ncbi:ATP-grasp domain-containing protein [Microbulbifer sp.]|uniref:ATP-grasp domain-containing protein n=1 Tax=Microbulbifer sp. TaxID=1908541 RepID=UPI002585D004|nr:ATP-grasp domain-containing protein [Microbulbifer sp.]